jgi:hypothetical protein
MSDGGSPGWANALGPATVKPGSVMSLSLPGLAFSRRK